MWPFGELCQETRMWCLDSTIILENKVEFSEKVASFDGHVSWIERMVQKFVHFLLHLLKLSQLGLLAALGYFVFVLMDDYHLFSSSYNLYNQKKNWTLFLKFLNMDYNKLVILKIWVKDTFFALCTRIKTINI